MIHRIRPFFGNIKKLKFVPKILICNYKGLPLLPSDQSHDRSWNCAILKPRRRPLFMTRIRRNGLANLQSWPKCVGHCAFFPNCCNIRSLPPSPPMQCWTTLRQAFPYEQHCMGKVEFGPKNVCLHACEKLIDGRGSEFCKLVPHNFGQDYSYDCQNSIRAQPKFE